MKVAVLDIGLGNLMSIKRGFERAGAEVSLVNGDEGPEMGSCGTCYVSGCADADAVVLPGVGAFHAGMRALSRFSSTIAEIKEGKAVLLGVCLGMQMLFSRSQEGGECRGLGLIKGDVVRLPGTVKVPHMGWNSISMSISSATSSSISNASGSHKLTQGLGEGEYFYFVHSYYCVPEDRGVISAEVEYGVRMPAIVEKGNVFGTQFHPEKSSTAGMSVIRNFLEAAKR